MKKNIERALFVIVIIAIVVLGYMRYTIETQKDVVESDRSDSSAATSTEEDSSTSTLQTDLEEANGEKEATVRVGGVVFQVEIADEPQEQARGLSEHTSLEERTGMLFVFDRMGDYPFWMKDMDFSIDMIWIDDSLEIVHIEEGVRPESYPTPYGSDSDAMYVLEIPARSVSQYAIEVGDRVQISI